MYKNPYIILQTYESASEPEVDFAYSRLKKQYSEDRFLPGEAGANAARMLTELEEAYKEAKQKFETKRSEADYGSLYGVIEDIIKQNKTNEAQHKLDEIIDRNAEWHYLQSIVYYKKSWYNESKNQLEMAVSMDPLNTKYKDALNRINVFMNNQAAGGNASATNTDSENKTYRQADEQINKNNQYQKQNQNQNNQFQNGRQYGNENRNMGGCGSGGPENCCLQLICADCCCECMGGDLILCC